MNTAKIIKDILKCTNETRYALPYLNLCRKLGISFSTKPIRTYEWTGQKLYLGKRTISDIFHDIAHYQMSTPKRRSLPDFGLGSGVDSKVQVEPVIPQTETAHEEWTASVMGVLWERTMGFNAAHTYKNHNWDSGWTPGFAAILKILYKGNFIDKNGIPKAILKTDNKCLICSHKINIDTMHY